MPYKLARCVSTVRGLVPISAATSRVERPSPASESNPGSLLDEGMLRPNGRAKIREDHVRPAKRLISVAPTTRVAQCLAAKEQHTSGIEAAPYLSLLPAAAESAISRAPDELDQSFGCRVRINVSAASSDCRPDTLIKTLPKRASWPSGPENALSPSPLICLAVTT